MAHPAEPPNGTPAGAECRGKAHSAPSTSVLCNEAVSVDSLCGRGGAVLGRSRSSFAPVRSGTTLTGKPFAETGDFCGAGDERGAGFRGFPGFRKFGARRVPRSFLWVSQVFPVRIRRVRRAKHAGRFLVGPVFPRFSEILAKHRAPAFEKDGVQKWFFPGFSRNGKSRELWSGIGASRRGWGARINPWRHGGGLKLTGCDFVSLP